MIFYDSAHNFSNPYKPLSYAVFEKLWLECQFTNRLKSTHILSLKCSKICSKLSGDRKHFNHS